MFLNQIELQVYSKLQQDVLADKVNTSYVYIQNKYGFTSQQQIEKFLFRTLLGFTLNNTTCDNGPIPLIPDVVAAEFIQECNNRATELNCIHSNKAVVILEGKLADRAIRAAELGHQIYCPFIVNKILERFSNMSISPQWFNHFCKGHGLKLLNPQSLEEVRRKYCNSNVITQFYLMLQALIHQVPHLLYNMDETSTTCTKKGKIVVPDGKFPLASEETQIGHITAICSCNAAGESLKPMIILPLILNLPNELTELTTQCEFASSPSGWMTSKVFFIWAMFFASEVNRRREGIARIYGREKAQYPCFLLMDGHKSRLNSDAIELLYKNNIRVIILPAHTSHVTQPFDVSIARAFKIALRASKDSQPKWLQEKLAGLNETARKRYLMVLAIIDAWKKAATTQNICSGWEKAGLYPINKERVLGSPYVRPSVPGDIPAPDNQRNEVRINGMEITTVEKRVELARKHYNNPMLMAPMPIPNQNQISAFIRSGRERILGYYSALILDLDNTGLRSIYF